MKFIGELDMANEKEAKALEQVLHKIAIGKVVVILKQIVKTGVDENGEDLFDNNDLQIAACDSGALVDMDGTLLYVTLRNLQKTDVKAIQNLWKLVRQRGKQRFLENRANDYYLTLDCVMIDEHHERQFTFGSLNTPLFCSSDGDQDLTMTFVTNECFIDISKYNREEIEYQAMKLAEEGKIANKTMEDEAIEDDEEKEITNDVLFSSINASDE